jgi:RNA polymerase sigma factor (sigma-70 family)
MSDDPFVTHRSLLFTVAYEMLGSAADAEDVVQETWLRWADVDRAEVRDPRAYLVRIVTRQALNRLRTLARQREEYVGEWLPEPLLTSPDVAEDVELAESVSMAMLTVLETLGHTERAVFVLREVFDTSYDEIADAVGKAPAAVRQIAHRARAHVAARRPRMQINLAEQRAVVERSWRPCRPATCEDCSTCSLPTSWSLPTGAAWWRRPAVRSREPKQRRGCWATSRGWRLVPGPTRCGSTAPRPRGSTSMARSSRLAWPSRTAGSLASTRSSTRTS